jgi:hypothetical protein
VAAAIAAAVIMATCRTTGEPGRENVFNAKPLYLWTGGVSIMPRDNNPVDYNAAVRLRITGRITPRKI